MFIIDAHDLMPKTLASLKRLLELAEWEKGKSIV
jgi:type II secretory pathway predicted ATPase ExeA